VQKVTKNGYQLPYPALKQGTEFWNRVRIPGSCYKSRGYT